MAAATLSFDSTRVMTRYSSAYLVARFVIGLGTSVKVVGGIVGLFIGMTVIAITQNAMRGVTPLVFGVVAGCLVFLIAFILATLVAAQGQILQANLDEAVHTSPFLSDEQRLTVMSLK
jgi:hypothetical protein